MNDFRAFFAHVHVISLKRRSDRLGDFFRRLEKHNWPFKWPEVFSAIDGGIVGCPPEFTQGDGAFGCRESHCCILREHLMNREEGWVLIFEDDAEVREDFADEMAKFIELVRQHAPEANGLMLGGQHHAPPDVIVPGLVKVKYAQRTHAYACRRHYMRALYHRWSTTVTAHIDWRMADWQVNQQVYAPQRWIVGQRGGMSDIRGAVKPAEWWNPPTGYEPVILLRAPHRVVVQLRERGFHTGFERDPKSDIDRGLLTCFESGLSAADRQTRLSDWVRVIQAECAADKSLVCTVWHPEATLEDIKAATRAPVHEIVADSVVDAMNRLPPDRPKQSGPPVELVILVAPRTVMEELRFHGFHPGYWRGDDGIDNGLREALLLPRPERISKLREWLAVLKDEARAFGGVPTAWHPDLRREILEPICNNPLEIRAATTVEALNTWRILASRGSVAPSFEAG